MKMDDGIDDLLSREAQKIAEEMLESVIKPAFTDALFNAARNGGEGEDAKQMFKVTLNEPFATALRAKLN